MSEATFTRIGARFASVRRWPAKLRLSAVAILPLLLGLSAAIPPAVSVDRQSLQEDYGRPEIVPFPQGNPYSKAKADLGRMLFFDPILSGSGTRSCASCHNPGLAWGDGLPKAVGEKQLALRSPTLINVAWIPVLGWDGKFHDLEAVAFAPITGGANMNRKEPELIAALAAIPGYRAAFSAAFPDGVIDRHNIELALATFERTIVSGTAPFDRWVEGAEDAIDDSAKRGFALFTGKAGCAECHSGWNFSDGSFHDIGTGQENDIGRARLFPNAVELRYAFKVPTLRDVARRAPYMHDGSEPSLEAVIDLYDRGGVDRPSRSELIKPLGLTAREKADLVAFLKTLTGEPVTMSVPVLPR